MVIEGYILRKATSKDTASIRHVVFTVLQEYGLMPNPDGKDADLNDVETYYFQPGGNFTVVISNDAIVGTVGLYPVNAHEVELRKMYLLAPHRGKGVGQWMLLHAIQVARASGFRSVSLETISPLKEAIALYRRHGFIEIKPRATSDRVDQAFVLLV